MLLYKYCNEKGIDIIRNLRFKVTPLNRLNDPFEWFANVSGNHLTFLDAMSQDFGVICLSETYDDVLMWSHYTGGHRGFVIGFDANHDFFLNPPTGPVQKVQYSSNPIEWDGDDETVDKLLVTKRDTWSYEKEWRSIISLRDCVHKRISLRQKGFFVKIQPQMIRRIILGPRASKHLRHKAITAGVWSGVAQVSIEQFLVMDGKFSFKSAILIDTTNFNST